VGKVVNRIPESLQNYMDKNEINQRQLAAKLDISEAAVSRILSGGIIKNVNLEILYKICNAIGVTPNDLLWENNA